MTSSPVAVVTGATSGLGRLTALRLAERGYDLVITARDSSKAASFREAVSRAAPWSKVVVVNADFTRLTSVARAGDVIASGCGRIDLLINNAGLHGFTQRVTEDGYSEMVCVNYLAPWLLTAKLQDRLKAFPPARIVTVGSEASRRSNGFEIQRDLDDTQAFTAAGSSVVYGRTKLMNIMFAKELARRLEGTGVTSTCIDPGFNVTGLGRELPFASGLEAVLRWLRIGSPERGAGLILRAATEPTLQDVNGAYYTVGRSAPIQPIAPGADPRTQQALWAATAERLDRFLAPAAGFHEPH
jgi:NAD(P)-dependent dehydrogenase (short-subunit alcohol dehydrogenase family)